MFHELLAISILYPEKLPNVGLKSAVPLFASAEGFEEYREETLQIFKVENIPSVLFMYVISNIPKRPAEAWHYFQGCYHYTNKAVMLVICVLTDSLP